MTMWLIGKSKRRTRAGVTLVEMLIVLGIVGIMVTTTVPVISGTARAALFRSHVYRLRARLRYAHQRAQLTREMFRTDFFSAANEYRVGAAASALFDAKRAERSIMDTVLGIHQLCADSVFVTPAAQTGVVSVFFYPDGSTSGLELRVQGASERRAIVRISVSGEIICVPVS